jgi:hypothetical protein
MTGNTSKKQRPIWEIRAPKKLHRFVPPQNSSTVKCEIFRWEEHAHQKALEFGPPKQPVALNVERYNPASLMPDITKPHPKSKFKTEEWREILRTIIC